MFSSKKNKLAWILCIVCLAFSILIIQQLHRQSTHFWPNTSIGNIDISRLSYQEAIKKIEKKRTAPGYVITDPKNKKILYRKNFKNIKTIDYEAQLKQRLTEQKHSLLWSVNHNADQFESLSLYKQNDLLTAVKQDQSDLTNYLNNINYSRTMPESGKVLIKDSKVSISPAQPGNQIAVKSTVKKVEQQVKYVQNGQIRVSATLFSKPWNGKATAKKLRSQMKQDFTYSTNNHQMTAKVSDILKNGSISKDNVSIDSKAASKFIEKFNQKYTLAGSKKVTFKTIQGKNVTFDNSEGTLGWHLNPTNEAQYLIQDLVSGKKKVSAKEILQPTQSMTKKNWNKKISKSDHIEVDLTHEKLYLVQNKKVVQQALINTGSPKINIATPTGVYYIKFKNAPITMRGFEKDGTPYKSYVPQADNLTDDGIFIHSAPWVKDSVFGDPTQRYNHGSNGCINVPPKDMAKLYKKTVVNEPVVVYGQG